MLYTALLVFWLIFAALLLGSGWFGASRRILQRDETVAGLRSDIIRLQRESAKLYAIFDRAHDGMVILSDQGCILFANPAFCRMLGRGLRDVLGRSPVDFTSPGDGPVEDTGPLALGGAMSGEGNAKFQVWRYRRKDGSQFWSQVSTSRHDSGTGESFSVLICRDVTRQIEAQQELELAQQKLKRAASHDAMTNVANRAELSRFLAREAGKAQAPDQHLGLINIDIDRFKAINDTHGHAAGDAVIMHVAATLRSAARSEDLVARLGGDEFVVACPDLPDLESLRTLTNRLFEAVSGIVAWNRRTLPCQVSVGAALSNSGERDMEEVMQRSDFALYEAKRAGRGRVAIYDNEVADHHLRQITLGRDLRHQIREGRLFFEFQPMLDLHTGQVMGLETLCRWNHPTEGFLSPARFLDLAAEQGLMAELDFCAMEAAIDQARRLVQGNHHGIRVSFNASSNLLAHPEFVERLLLRTADARLLPDALVIEVLETVVLGEEVDDSQQMRAIAALNEAGFRVVLDDFGTGYAGLAHLAQLPMAGVKIDRSLVQRVLTDETSRKITLTMLELCADLGLRVVAEGVESKEFADWLRDSGCRFAQGFWFSRPLASGAVSGFLETHDPAHFARRPPAPEPRASQWPELRLAT